MKDAVIKDGYDPYVLVLVKGFPKLTIRSFGQRHLGQLEFEVALTSRKTLKIWLRKVMAATTVGVRDMVIFETLKWGIGRLGQ